MRSALWAATCLALAGALPAAAQERVTEVRPGADPAARRANTLLGAKVTLRERGLGEVADLVFSEEGCIDFLVVRAGSDYVVVPWSVVTFSPERRAVVVNADVTRERLRGVIIQEGRWPNLYGPEFSRGLRSVRGERAVRPRHRGVAPEERRPEVKPEERRPEVRPPASRGTGPPLPRRRSPRGLTGRRVENALARAAPGTGQPASPSHDTVERASRTAGRSGTGRLARSGGESAGLRSLRTSTSFLMASR